MNPKEFKIPSIDKSEIVYKNRLMTIKKDTLRLENHPPYDYYSVSTFPASVVVLPITREGLFLLTEEYRHPTRQVIIGCPGGYIDENEDPMEAASRELFEETGYKADSLHSLGSAYPYAGVSGQKVYYFCALGVYYAAPPLLEAAEIIRVRPASLETVNQLIDDQIPLDANFCTAFFLLKRKKFLESS